MRPVKIAKTVTTIGIMRHMKFSPRVVGKYACAEFGKLGGGWVKMCQLASSRPDVFGPELCEELKELRKDAPSMRHDEVCRVLRESDLGGNIDVSSLVAVGSASIGQVFVGSCVSRGGESVALKIRRPSVVRLIESDVAMLRTLISIAGVNEEVGAVVDDMEEVLNAECDFGRELRSQMQFAEKYGHLVKIPRPYPDLSTENVLVMEYVVSEDVFVVAERLTKKQRKSLAVDIMSAFVSMVLSGLVHADPHAGNLGVVIDDATSMPRLVVYDYGNVMHLDEQFVHLTREFVVTMIANDTSRAIDTLEKMGVRVKDRQAMVSYLRQYRTYLSTLDIRDLQTSLQSQRGDIPATLPPVLLRVIRIFGLIEGVVKSVSPDFSYWDLLPSFAQDVLLDEGFLLYKASQDIQNFFSK